MQSNCLDTVISGKKQKQIPCRNSLKRRNNRKERVMANHNHQKKIALINDYTGFGRCSVAVQLPIISMLKVQCCALPTSIFSNHTGFESFFLHGLYGQHAGLY